MTAATHSPGIWNLHHVDGRDDVVALRDGRGELIALLPIRRPERRDLFMGLPIEGGEDLIQERNLEIIRLAPQLLAELEKMVSGNHALHVGMFCLGGISEEHANKLADQRVRGANSLIAKARGDE